MKILLTVALLATATISVAQDWGNWIDVGNGIQVSFKFGKEPCTFANTRARLKNVSSRMYKVVKVSFNTNCPGYSSASVDAYDFAPGTIKESSGDIYSTYLRVSTIRLTKLIDAQNNNLVSGGAGGATRPNNLGGSVSMDGDNVVNPVNRPAQQYATPQRTVANQPKQQTQAAQKQQTTYQQQQAEAQRRQDEAARQQQELALRQQAAQEQYNQQMAALEQEQLQREKTIEAVGELAQQLMSVEVNKLEKSDHLFLFEGGINSLTSPWLVGSLTKSLGKSPLAWRLDITMLKKKGLSLNISFGGLKQENNNFLLTAINNGKSTLYKGLMTGNLFCTQLSAGKDIRSSNNRLHLYLGPNLSLNTVMEHSFTYNNGSDDYQEATIQDSYWGYGFQFKLRYFLGDKIALSTGWEYNTFFATPSILAPYKTHGYGSYNAGLGIRF